MSLTEIPRFGTYDDALRWCREQEGRYRTKTEFRCSAEYRAAWPQIKRLWEAHKTKMRTGAEQDMRDAGVQYGDTVACVYPGMFFASYRHEGRIRRGAGGRPVVRGMGRQAPWHKGYRLVRTGDVL